MVSGDDELERSVDGIEQLDRRAELADLGLLGEIAAVDGDVDSVLRPAGGWELHAVCVGEDQQAGFDK